nr:activating signal cointegrator 1 complex subunit 2 homolog [Lytechinus pictus]
MQGIQEDSWPEFQIGCLNLVHRYRQRHHLFKQAQQQLPMTMPCPQQQHWQPIQQLRFWHQPQPATWQALSQQQHQQQPPASQPSPPIWMPPQSLKYSGQSSHTTEMSPAPYISHPCPDSFTDTFSVVAVSHLQDTCDTSQLPGPDRGIRPRGQRHQLFKQAQQQLPMTMPCPQQQHWQPIQQLRFWHQPQPATWQARSQQHHQQQPPASQPSPLIWMPPQSLKSSGQSSHTTEMSPAPYVSHPCPDSFTDTFSVVAVSHLQDTCDTSQLPGPDRGIRPRGYFTLNPLHL